MEPITGIGERLVLARVLAAGVCHFPPRDATARQGNECQGGRDHLTTCLLLASTSRLDHGKAGTMKKHDLSGRQGMPLADGQGDAKGLE